MPAAGRTRAPRAAVLGAVVFLLTAVVAAVLLISDRPDAERTPELPLARAGAASSSREPTTGEPSSSASPSGIVVSVVGKVHTPGLVTVPDGSRVANAVEAAGGAVRGTNLTALNLARKLTDGEQIYVGIPAPPGMAPEAGAPAAGQPAGQAEAKVDLNTATKEQLEELPGIGPVTAESILEWRTKNDRFTAVEQLREVDGIGEVRFEKLRDKVAAG
ncbi:MAG: ComEA family DNA-binding protein [Pseudonocardiaceae bacterium]|nr:ComEA family DNA-binding protein [Pseudonocardiaceae bacterium]